MALSIVSYWYYKSLDRIKWKTFITIIICHCKSSYKFKRQGQTRLYTDKLKQLALTIQFLGPKVYTFLMKTLSLLNPCTLKWVTQCYQLMPGLNNFFLKLYLIKILIFSIRCFRVYSLCWWDGVEN